MLCKLFNVTLKYRSAKFKGYCIGIEGTSGTEAYAVVYFTNSAASFKYQLVHIKMGADTIYGYNMDNYLDSVTN